MPLDPLNDEDFEEFYSSEPRQLRLNSLKEAEKVHENSDNKELYKLLVIKHLVTDNRFREAALKEFIDIQNHIQSIKRRCEESGCALPNTKDDDKEDIWEEGNYLRRAAYPHVARRQEIFHIDQPQTSNKSKIKKTRMSEEGVNDSSSLKDKLMAEVPSSFLDNWGSNRDILANQRGLELEGHGGRVDYDVQRRFAELNVHTIVYKEECNEIQPCRTPLSKGGLYQRRDLKICPFHGPIIPRDEGKPVNVSPTLDEKVLDLGADLADKLAQKAVKNLAKVREHNKAVLRDASVASTLRSMTVGDLDATSNALPMSKSKKQTLTSIL
ncbi:UV-stimulated scaffold protein A [Dillenia turbinata]|uniref:UV-stimulated scaffold protein A n=1 Tax=Dillenia turbinata TaxID=194707 RepID=A0AAN8Z3A4_9MAGN